MESKEVLRKKYISIRNNIQNKEEKAKIITRKVIATEINKEAKIVALYKSLASEVSTEELIKRALSDGKIVALPKVVGDDLKFYKISLDDNFTKSNFGVEEPEEKEENFINKNQIDLVIAPGVCFDKNKNRMGFGKGFYDRFLSYSDLKTIGICFEEQVLNELPVDSNDIKMCKIITDGKCYE